MLEFFCNKIIIIINIVKIICKFNRVFVINIDFLNV